MSSTPYVDTVDLIAEDPNAGQDRESYHSILKSTSLIGGASVLNIIIGMVRTKFAAILLGPAGVGLLGMYGQIIALGATATGMGIGSSGVRQVAEAVGSYDDERIARTVITLRRTAWLTGVLGMLAMILLCVPISGITFGRGDYALPIALLGLTLLLSAITSGQACILQGTRRIADLAKISVTGAVTGTVISVPCFYFWGQQGIVVSLILCAIALLITSWWYARRVPIKPVALSWRASSVVAKRLVTLGISFMGAGLAATLSNYLIPVLLIREFGLAEVGIYQAAFVLSGILVGFVLSAMGTDYYPRLTAVANDNASVYKMVNEQSQVSILLALPGLVAMMIFAPLIIRIFYTASFVSAVPILRWCTLGVLGRVFSWPLGFVMMAKGKGRLFFITEVVFAGIHLFAVYIFCKIFGLDGAGIAFMVLYVSYTLVMLVVTRGLVGSTWARKTFNQSLIATTAMVVLMLNCTLNNTPIIAWMINLAVLAVVLLFCFKQLIPKSGIDLYTLLTKIGMKKNK